MTRFISFIGWLIVSCLNKTLRVREVNALESWKKKGGPGFLFSFWHGEQLIPLYHHRNQNAVVMSSLSKDGEIQTGILENFGYKVVRGSSTRGGERALVETIRLVKHGHSAAFAVDPAARAAVTIPSGYAEAKAPPAPGSAPAQGWGGFLLVAFGFGLASIFTPCVFPMIPITMSYFLNRGVGDAGHGRGDGLTQAVVFCLGIVVLFSGLGLATTAILGPFGVVQLGSNPWVNGFIAALFLAFGLSLLGAFEITIPSSILTRLNASSGRGGFAGTLLMGLTFSLASFACVGLFVGTLLAASVGGGGARPVAGMWPSPAVWRCRSFCWRCSPRF